MGVFARNQPQGLARLNCSNSLTRGAQAIISAHSDFNLVSGQRLSITGSGYAKAAGPAGIAKAFRSNFYLETETLTAVGTASCVEFWVGIPRDLYNWGKYAGGATSNVYAFGTGSTATTGIFFGGGTLATPSWGAVSNWSAVNDTGEVLTVGRMYVLVMVRRQDRMELWRDGRLIQTFLQAPASWAAGKLVLGGFVEDTSYWVSSSDTLLAGRILGEWSADQVRNFSANPWQLFDNAAKTQFPRPSIAAQVWRAFRDFLHF